MSRTLKEVLVYLVSVGFLLVAVYFVVTVYVIDTFTVIKKRSPDKKHSAKLITRDNGIDINLLLWVDGRLVYTSPDFAAPMKADFQERVMWDQTHRIVVLEAGGERLVGYHVVQKRTLHDSELPKVQLAPFADLRFTADLPSTASAVDDASP